MDFSILESLGKIAGIAVGVLAILFKGVLQKEIFPKLNREQGYSIIRTIIYLSFFIAVLGLISWTLSSINKKENSSTSILNVIGTIKNQNNKPAKGVKVFFKQEQNNFDKTDDEGNFVIQIKGNNTSFYDLMVDHKDFYSFNKKIELDFSSGKQEIKPIKLQLLPTKKEKKNNPRKVEHSEKATTNISLIYRGDVMECNLQITVNIDGKIYTPNSNPAILSNVTLGLQNYSINGTISCINGSCNISGNGKINIQENQTLYVVWVNDSIGHCTVSLSAN